MNRRQPRSRREIVNSLKEMMEADLVEVSNDLVPDPQDPLRKASKPHQSLTSEYLHRKQSLANSSDISKVNKLMNF